VQQPRKLHEKETKMGRKSQACYLLIQLSSSELTSEDLLRNRHSPSDVVSGRVRVPAMAAAGGLFGASESTDLIC